MTTLEAYDEIIRLCADIFQKKNQDYGSSWRIMRLSSITDQILIKAARIRSIEEKGSQEVADPIEEDYMGIINYAIIGIIQKRFGGDEQFSYSEEEVWKAYKDVVKEIRALLEAKNSDYGEIWKKMRVSSYTDLILMKLERLQQIHDHKNEVRYSEGLESHYMDIVNYSIFALIKTKSLTS
ncbi:MAG TPA: DUF1599 domain-containing protein [Saprospiraceae bacterium]|nr:DUF1599 domain-containing protein [Saprospiraceae bacterium]